MEITFACNPLRLRVFNAAHNAHRIIITFLSRLNPQDVEQACGIQVVGRVLSARIIFPFVRVCFAINAMRKLQNFSFNCAIFSARAPLNVGGCLQRCSLRWVRAFAFKFYLRKNAHKCLSRRRVALVADWGNCHRTYLLGTAWSGLDERQQPSVGPRNSAEQRQTRSATTFASRHRCHR